MSHFLAGLLAGIILASALTVYVLVRGNHLVTFFKSLDQNVAHISDRGLFVAILMVFWAVSLVFGIMAGLVYDWLPEPSYFPGLAVGSALALNLIAVVSRTPLTQDKIVWNIAVGGFLGILIPFFSSM